MDIVSTIAMGFSCGAIGAVFMDWKNRAHTVTVITEERAKLREEIESLNKLHNDSVKAMGELKAKVSSHDMILTAQSVKGNKNGYPRGSR